MGFLTLNKRTDRSCVAMTAMCEMRCLLALCHELTLTVCKLHFSIQTSRSACHSSMTETHLLPLAMQERLSCLGLRILQTCTGRNLRSARCLLTTQQALHRSHSRSITKTSVKRKCTPYSLPQMPWLFRRSSVRILKTLPKCCGIV
jgi:hypothetical protein